MRALAEALVVLETTNASGFPEAEHLRVLRRRRGLLRTTALCAPALALLGTAIASGGVLIASGPAAAADCSTVDSTDTFWEVKCTGEFAALSNGIPVLARSSQYQLYWEKDDRRVAQLSAAVRFGW